MKLLISQLKDGENVFRFESPKEGWVNDIIHRVEKQGYHLRSTLQIDVKLTKLEPDYYLKGRLEFTVQQVCARCAEGFPLPVRHTFDVAMAHVSHVKARTAEMAEESEELDVNFFEGNDVDLSPVVEEQFFLSLPYQAVCKVDCKGLCQQCGKNRNLVDCDCKTTSLNPFSTLKDLKV